jgi:hypothetical protein
LGGAVPATCGVDFSGVLHFFEGHTGFPSEMLFCFVRCDLV